MVHLIIFLIEHSKKRAEISKEQIINCYPDLLGVTCSVIYSTVQTLLT